MNGLRSKQGPRVTATETKKHKMHKLKERHGLHYAKNLKNKTWKHTIPK